VPSLVRTAGLAHYCNAGTAAPVGVERDHEDSPRRRRRICPL
jgi:hypothetical protein